MAQKIYEAALVGCGRIGYSLGLDKKREQPASHTMALNDNSRIRLVAGCDRDPLTLTEWHNANKKTLIYRDSADRALFSNPPLPAASRTVEGFSPSKK